MKDSDILDVALKHKLPVVSTSHDGAWAYAPHVLAFGRDLVGEEWPDVAAFPPTPFPVHIHSKLGDLFARFDMQMYAVKFEKRTLETIGAALGLCGKEASQTELILERIKEMQLHPEHCAMGSWWVKSLLEFWGNGSQDMDTRRAAKVACNMAAQLHAGNHGDRRDAFEAIYPIPANCERCGDGYTATSHNAWDAHTHIARWEGFKSCALRADPKPVAATAWTSRTDRLPTEPGWYLVVLAENNDFELMSDTPLQVEFDSYKDLPGEFTHFDSWSNSNASITSAVVDWIPMPAKRGASSVAPTACDCTDGNVYSDVEPEGSTCPSCNDGYPVRLLNESDASLAWRVDSWHQRNPSAKPVECAARKQGTAGGNDAAECDWPGCDCDPVAGKVIEALMDQHNLATTFAQRDVLKERNEQVTREGFTPAHDDAYKVGQLATVGGCYAMHYDAKESADEPLHWPWGNAWWKPSTPRRNLVKAAACIIAEIEKIDRQSATGAN